MNILHFSIANAEFIMVIIILVKTVWNELTVCGEYYHDDFAYPDDGCERGTFPRLDRVVDHRGGLKRPRRRKPEEYRKTACLTQAVFHKIETLDGL